MTSLGNANVKTVEERVIVKLLPPKEETDSGFIIPLAYRDRNTRGHVVAVGKRKRSKKGFTPDPEFNVGDLVLFDRYNGQEMKMDDGVYLLVKYDDIHGVVEE